MKVWSRFKRGMFFVSSIIHQAKHELTSKADKKSILLQLSQVKPTIIAEERSFGSFSEH